MSILLVELDYKADVGSQDRYLRIFLAVYILAILLCALGDLACKNQLQLDENYSDL